MIGLPFKAVVKQLGHYLPFKTMVQLGHYCHSRPWKNDPDILNVFETFCNTALPVQDVGQARQAMIKE